MSPGTSTIPLSNVKRLFRSRYHTELSETALGHSKLSELLQDPKLKDICHVRLQGHGYVVGPAGPGPVGPIGANVPQNLHGQHGHGHGKGQVVASYPSAHQQPLMQVPVAPAPKCNVGNMSSMGMIPPTNLAPNLSQAAQGAVVISQAMRDAARPETKTCNKFYNRPDLAPGHPGHPGGHPGHPGGHPVHPGLYENERGDRPSLRDRAHFVPPAPLSMEDVEEEAPRMVPWKSLSPESGTAGTLRSRRDHFEATVSMGLDEMNLPGVPNTPLPLMPATPDTPGFPKWSNNRATDGLAQFSIQNTFIHCPMPSTPCQGRSQSLPRNLYQRSEDDADWSKSEALSQHPANRLMSAAAAAADPLAPMVPNQKVHPISAAPQPPSNLGQSLGSQPGFHPQNYTNPGNPGASTIRLADLL